jgi:hypothetical protein
MVPWWLQTTISEWHTNAIAPVEIFRMFGTSIVGILPNAMGIPLYAWDPDTVVVGGDSTPAPCPSTANYNYYRDGPSSLCPSGFVSSTECREDSVYPECYCGWSMCRTAASKLIAPCEEPEINPPPMFHTIANWPAGAVPGICEFDAKASAEEEKTVYSLKCLPGFNGTDCDAEGEDAYETPAITSAEVEFFTRGECLTASKFKSMSSPNKTIANTGVVVGIVLLSLFFATVFWGSAICSMRKKKTRIVE